VEGVPEGNPAPLDVETLAGRSVLTLITHRGPLDVSFVPEGTSGYADLVTRGARRPIAGHGEVPVADLADVITSKAAAGRPKDIRQLPTLRRILARLRSPGTEPSP
jgi:hypothetical protein